MDQILRTPTADELKEYTDISKPSHRRNDINTMFREKMNELEKEFTKSYEPFDSQCARLDFSEKLERAQKEILTRSENRATANDIIKVEIGDLRKYADKKRMNLVTTKEKYTDKLIDGIRQSVLTDFIEYWVCNDRKHSIKVFISAGKYLQRYPGKVKDYPELSRIYPDLFAKQKVEK